MNILKQETVELSAEEKKAFDLVGRILDNISEKAEDPNLIEKAVQLKRRFYQFYVYLKQES